MCITGIDFAEVMTKSSEIDVVINNGDDDNNKTMLKRYFLLTSCGPPNDIISAGHMDKRRNT